MVFSYCSWGFQGKNAEVFAIPFSRNWCLWVGEDSWKSPGLQGDQTINPKENQSWIFIGGADAEAEAPIFWPPDVKDQLIGKDPDAGKDWRQKEKGMTEDEMFWWHHWLNGHEFEQAPGVGDGQGSLACCSPGSQRVGHSWVTAQQQQPSGLVAKTLHS